MEVQNNIYLNFSIHNQEQTFVPFQSLFDLNSNKLLMINQSVLFYEVLKDEKLAKEAMKVAEKKFNLKKRIK